MRHTFQMNEFDAYKIYLAFKLHFTSEKYDITKTKGAVKFKKESFYKRQDQLSFQRLAEEFTDATLPKFLIANHIDGNIWGGVFRYEEAVRVYHKWEGRIQSLTENFKTDLEKIVLELAEEDMNKFDKCFVIKDGQHPLLLKMYSRKEVNIETIIMLDGINKFLSYWNKELADDFFWIKERQKILKYKPFLHFDVDKCKDLFYSRKRLYDTNLC